MDRHEKIIARHVLIIIKYNQYVKFVDIASGGRTVFFLQHEGSCTSCKVFTDPVFDKDIGFTGVFVEV